MVKSINEVGQVMGIRTIAEYAASENIINSLREIGVDNAQGYAVAKPVPLDAIDDNNVDKIDGKSELKLKSTTNITKLSGD
jgi:EAL domain-containing protein (putative c-di-GMP-specific phosphodiesterase class I)